MAVGIEQGRAEDDDILGQRRPYPRAVDELQQAAARVQGRVRNGSVEKVSGMTVGIRHAMGEALVIVALDELDALIAQAEIIPVDAEIASDHMVHAAVEVDDNTVQAIDRVSDLVLAIEIDARAVAVAAKKDRTASGRHRQEQGRSGKPEAGNRFCCHLHNVTGYHKAGLKQTGASLHRPASRLNEISSRFIGDDSIPEYAQAKLSGEFPTGCSGATG